MTKGHKINSVRTAAIVAAALASFVLGLILAPAAQAADPIFPIGSHIGLVPPAGMTVSKGFLGFEDVVKDSAILIAAQPPAAYPEIEKSLATDVLKKNGISVDNREEMTFDFGQGNLGKGTLVIGKQTADKTRYRKWLLNVQTKDLTALVNVQIPEQETAYPDATIRAALATLAVRPTIPDAEKLSMLPFTLGDLAGLHVENVLPGRAVMLIDTPDGVPTDKFDLRMFIAAFDGGPNENEDRAQFARMTFGQIVGIKDVQITMSEPLRIGGQSGFQTTAQAKDMKTGDDIMVAQWLRFGSGGFMQMIGMAKAGVWSTALTRLRAVRDGIQLK
jgi:hypothetical protein